MPASRAGRTGRPPAAATRLLRRPRLLVVGCGDIGRRIVARLGGRFRVTGVVSGEQSARRVRAAGARALVIDLDQPRRARRRLPPGAWVLHLAPTSPAGTRDERTLRVLREACVPGARITYVGTTGVYGDRGGGWVDEATPPAPSSARARRRLAAEMALRAATRRGRALATILRAPGIYAADRLPLERLRAGVPTLLAQDDVFTNHIHAEDLARACILALLRGAPGRTINAVDGTRLPLGEYLDLVADSFGLPRPRDPGRAQLPGLVDPARLSFLSESRRIRNARLTGELGLRLRHPDVASGIADALAQSGRPGA